MRQLFFWDTGHPLEVIMTGIAKMRCPEAEEHSHGATVTAFILQEIGPVFGAHLQQKESCINTLVPREHIPCKQFRSPFCC